MQCIFDIVGINIGMYMSIPFHNLNNFISK